MAVLNGWSTGNPDRIEQQISGRQRPVAELPEPYLVAMLLQEYGIIQHHPELERTPEQVPDQFMAANLPQPVLANRQPVLEVHISGQRDALFLCCPTAEGRKPVVQKSGRMGGHRQILVSRTQEALQTINFVQIPPLREQTVWEC